MFDFLEREIDSQRFDEFIAAVKNGNCVAFTGAGLSRPLGYRIWNEGIIKSNSATPTLTQLAQIPTDELSNDSLPDVIDKCRVILKEDYINFLKNEFGRNGKDKHHPNLYLLWKSNFKHFITTNFDASLYDNREECENLVTYPSRELAIQKERTLYHLHGRAFITSKETEETLKYYLENLIYGRQSYIDAYDSELGDGSIEIFIYSIIQKYNIFFIGFSMNDEDFKNTYKHMDKRWYRYMKKINEHPDRKKEIINNHYIFLPYPQKNEYEKEEDYIKEKDSFEYRENDLAKINIIVIAYKKIGIEEHKGISQALEYIIEQAPYYKIKELNELGIQPFKLSSASTNEVER